MDKKDDPFAALRIKEFNLFIASRLLLTLGLQMQGVVVGWQIYEHTKDALSLGFIGLAEAIPFIGTAIFAGHVADVVERKKIIMLATSAFALCALALLYFTLDISNVISLYGTLPVYSVIFITGIARGFLGPSFFAFLSQLVPRQLYANASTWNATIWQIAAVIGPALGGLIYGFWGVTQSYLVDVILIILAIGIFSFIKPKPLTHKKKEESLFSSLSAGLKFVKHNQIVLGALSLDMFAVLFGGAVALLPIFADQILHVGPEGLGLLRAAPSFGAVVAALTMVYRPPTKKAGRNLLLAVIAFGTCMILFGISTNFYFSLFILFLSGAFDNISVVVRSTILQLMTPDDMRGRVSAINSIFIGSSNEIGEFESGITAKLMGLVPSVVFGGCMTVGVVAVTGKLAPKLRKLDLNSLINK